MSSEPSASAPSDGDTDENPYITRILLQNFMCHENFEIQLGRRLNLIYGTNGSGKSTILTAIMVALGSKARTTSRSESLGSLVMSGKPKAWIHVTFCIPPGYGELSRRFGNSVTVTRIIGSRGDSTYQIADASGKKLPKGGIKDVKLICYHFGIYPDNELAMMTQENAKEFLVSATGRVKYEKLQRALLQHIIAQNQRAVETSQTDHEHILSMMKAREQAVELMEISSREVLSRADEQVVRKQRLRTIDNILVWRKYDSAVQSLREVQQTLDAQEEELAGMQVERDYDQEHADYLAEMEALNNELHRATDEHDRISSQLGEAEKEKVEGRSHIHRSAEDVAESREKIKRLKKEIADLEERAADHSPEKLAKRRKRLEQDRESSEARRNEALDARAELDESIEKLRSKQAELTSTIRELQSEGSHVQKAIHDSNVELQHLNSGQSTSRVRNPLHSKHERLQQLIDRKTGWQHAPLGPLYKFLEMRDDGADYSPALERLWNQMLDCWWVQTEHDRVLLKQLALSSGFNNIRIILRRDDAFDFSSSLPRPSSLYKRALDLISVESDAIKRILVDLNRIESMVMVSGVREAFAVLKEDANVRNVLAVSTTRGGRTKFTQVSVNPARTDSATVRASDIVRIRVGTKARADQVRLSIRELQAQADTLKERLLSEKKDQMQLADEIQQCERKIMKVENVMRRSEDEIASISQEIMNIDTDVGVGDYAADTARIRSEIAKAEEDVAEGTAALAGFEAAFAEISHELENFKAQKQEWSGKAREIQARIREMEKKQFRSNQERHRHSRLVAQKEKAIQELQARLRSLEPFVEEAKEDAERTSGSDEPPQRDDTDRDLFDMDEEELSNERRTLLNKQEVLAASEEEIRKAKDQVTNASDAREEIDQKRREIEQFSKTIEKRHKIRELNEKRAWNTMKEHIQRAFCNVLKHRKFIGQLTIDDTKKSLTVESRPEGNANRKVSTLSGGEKSFTQMALLMGVWASMQVGLVALDEYDVFMDKVNRSTSLWLLGKTVSSSKMQCILITPQDVDTSVLDGTEFKMHKLRPARAR